MRKAAKGYIGEEIFSETSWLVMMALLTLESVSRDGCSIRAVAARAGLPRNTALRALNALETIGFVTLSPDKIDHRAMNVRLTDAGLSAIERSITAAATGIVRL
jgi:DNA-binding MarR family transcriptional regulator